MKNLNRLVFFIISFFMLTPAYAEATALDVVKNTAQQVIDRLKNESDIKNNPKKINQLVDDLIAPNFDFPKMSRWVLGKNWRSATKEQQNRFTDAFEKLLIRTYSKALVRSDNVDINYLPVHASEDSKKVTIKTEIDRLDGSPLVPINYRLYKSSHGWKVYDVSVDGVSLVSTYRGTFNDEIKKKGLDALIESLEARS